MGVCWSEEVSPDQLDSPHDDGEDNRLMEMLEVGDLRISDLKEDEVHVFYPGCVSRVGWRN